MTCNVLSTGSHGNAVLLGGAVLIDCGISLRRLEPYLSDLRLVLLTHRHSDHFRPSTLSRLHFLRPGLRFVCPPDLAQMLVHYVSPTRITVINPGETVTFPGLAQIRSFSLIHDVPNVGYLLRMGEETALYATDTQYIPISAPELDLYLIEANFEQEEIAQRMERKLTGGSFSHEGRTMATHMSQETALAWLHQNAHPTRSHIIFLHRHTPTA